MIPSRLFLQPRTISLAKKIMLTPLGRCLPRGSLAVRFMGHGPSECDIDIYNYIYIYMYIYNYIYIIIYICEIIHIYMLCMYVCIYIYM